MKKTYRITKPGIVIIVAIMLSCNNSDTKEDNSTAGTATKENVLEYLSKVNDKWQAENSDSGQWAFWHPAAYHIGNLAAYGVTKDRDYLNYTLRWAEFNQWSGAKSADPEEWKFTYGETDEHVLFGDWQACFQVYIDLYHIEPDTNKIARAREVMEYQVNTEEDQYWWWIDGLFMVMPVMPRMYKLTEDTIYLHKLYQYYSYTKSLMYDEDAGLWYRDTKYIFPDHMTQAGKKDFWSRGNGWVIAAHARTLDMLLVTDPYYTEYRDVYIKMAEALKNAQQDKGYWTRSLLDPDQAPGPETSGTAFFVYGILWGINHGLLDKELYAPVVEKGWKYLTEAAVQKDGTLGYVQPIGERAEPDQIIDQRSTSDFGVGAFLLAVAEMIRYLENE